MENKELQEKDFEFDDVEVEELKKTIQVLTEQRDVLLENKLPSNADKYAVDYIKLTNEKDLAYLTTKEVFDNYLEYRRKYTQNGEELLTVRMLNKIIKNFYPRAKINHSNKQGKNTYFWVFEEE